MLHSDWHLQMPDTPLLHHTPKGDLRRDAFIKVASQLFLERGFDAVSVNDIVRQAGGSLSTLYSYFPTKKDVVLAVAKQTHEQALADRLSAANDSAPVEVTLGAAARAYVARLSRPDLLAMWQIMVSTAPRFREEVRAFVLERKRVLMTDIGRYLGRQCELGTLDIDDVDIAAEQFLGLIRGLWVMEALCGLDEATDPRRLEHLVSESVTTFLARYRKRSS
jgi:AcrR family transcriptional regulator